MDNNTEIQAVADFLQRCWNQCDPALKKKIKSDKHYREPIETPNDAVTNWKIVLDTVFDDAAKFCAEGTTTCKKPTTSSTDTKIEAGYTRRDSSSNYYNTDSKVGEGEGEGESNSCSTKNKTKNKNKNKRIETGHRRSRDPDSNKRKNEGDNRHPKKTKAEKREILRIGARVDIDVEAVRTALGASKKVPESLRKALGTAALELNNENKFLLVRKNWKGDDKVNIDDLTKILKKYPLPGWLEWLQGQQGWIVIAKNDPYVQYHRKLQECYNRELTRLLEKHQFDPDIIKHLKYEGNKGDLVWKRVPKKGPLRDAVMKIRPFLERLRGLCKGRMTTLPWLKEKKRIKRISGILTTLLRTSHKGPDAPVHWAHHESSNCYPRATISDETMTELVVGTANILSNFFLPKPIHVQGLDGVDRMLRTKFGLRA